MGLLNVKRINQTDLRFKAHRFLSSTVMLTLGSFFVVQNASAQTVPCDGFNVTPLSFSGATLSSGANLQPGAIYDFSNVAPGVNGQVEILGTFNGASLSAIDNDGGLTGYLQPELVPNPAGGGYAAFRVSFINAVSGQPEALDFAATQIDVDGDSQTLREFVEFDTSLSQFTVDTTTELLINASGPTSSNLSRFESTTSNTAPGIDPTAQENVVRAIYTNATSYDFVYGTLGAGATTRLASVGFDCPSIPNPVNTIPVMMADLVTVKSLAASSSAAPEIGDVVTYEITVTNNGPDAATNINLTDNLPVGLTATPNNGAVTDGTFIGGDWSIPFLQNGGTATLTLEGTVDTDQGGNTITNTLVAPAVSDAEDLSTAGDDLTEAVTVETPAIEAVDNDFTANPIAPGLGGVTASIFANDTLNGAAFAPTAVTATITDDGSVFGATLNPDGTVDIPAGTAPGIYEIVYEICDVNDPTNCDTATVRIAIQASAVDTHNQPDVCGAFLSQAWVTHGKLNLHDTEVRIGSGDFATDPYLYLPIERDADGRIVTYFGAADGTDSGTISTPGGNNLAVSSNDDPAHEAEFNVLVYRLEGEPGSTLTANLNTRVGQEYTAYWIEDSAGNVISNSDFQFTTGTPNIGGVGEALPLSFTTPADGLAYLNAAIYDPSVAFGRPVVSDYECPLPELELTKVADDNTNRAVGDTITYTYTAENIGNIDISDITVSDVHNGSGALSSITIDALTNTSGDSSDDAADNDIDVLAPGDSVTFEATYVVTLADVTAGSDITNTATLTGTAAAGTLTDPTASESVSLFTPVTPPPLPPLDPGVCGGVLAEAYLLDGMGIGAEPPYQLASGSPTHDPDVFFGIFGAEPAYSKNADGSVVYYFDGEAPAQAVNTDVNTPTAIRNISSVNGVAADQTDGAEFWRITARIDGVPGESYNYTLDNGNAHEFLHYWLEDSAGNVIDSTLGDPNTANGWLYGAGGTGSTSSDNGATSISAIRNIPVSYTIPASSPDGIVYLRVMVLDPQVGWGPLNLTDAPECPLPELELTKVADDNTDRAIGDTIIYTYTAENTGNIDIADVTVSDVHNGSGALSPIAIGALTNTSGDSSDDAADNAIDVLAPGDSVTFEASYVVTEADVIAGAAVTNTATGTGTPPVGAFTDPTASESVTIAPLSADLSVTKTNTAGVNGEVDQAADTLTSGDVTTYTLTVTNNGPDGMSGAVVTDVVGAGLTCAGTDPVTLTGDGVPAGSFTVADLTGAGITLGRLEDTEATVLSYDCTVN